MFDSSKYIKSTNKSAVSRIVDTASNNISTQFNANMLSKSTNSKLINSGVALISSENISNMKVDSILSDASNEFFAAAKSITDRALGADISSLRTKGSRSINDIINNINPATKISRKRSGDDLDILSVL